MASGPQLDHELLTPFNMAVLLQVRKALWVGRQSIAHAITASPQQTSLERYSSCRPGHAAALRLGKGPQVAEDVAAVWAGCVRAREQVSLLLRQPGHASAGVCMLAAKFLESTMLLISAEPSSASKAPAAQHTLLGASLVRLNLRLLFNLFLLTPSIYASKRMTTLHLRRQALLWGRCLSRAKQKVHEEAP